MQAGCSAHTGCSQAEVKQDINRLVSCDPRIQHIKRIAPAEQTEYQEALKQVYVIVLELGARTSSSCTSASLLTG